MKIAISGASGFLGSALTARLVAAGHEVFRLVRSAARQKRDIAWDPARGTLDAAGLEGLDAVVHLAGENIAAGRWTKTQKTRIRQSRIQGTRLLAETIAGLKHPPKVLLSASAIGYYGNRGDDWLDEQSSPGGGFLADVCQDWERETQPARNAQVRVVHLRFGMILSPQGGALAKMLFPFRLGLGGCLGSGRQWMSWISLPDAVAAIEHALARDELAGPVNVVAPEPVTNREFTKSLGRALHRPTVLPMPAPLARLAFGQMANELLLASTRVRPRSLQETGFQFQHPRLDAALADLLSVQ